KTAPRIVLPNFFGHAQPGLLEQIFGLGWLAHHAQQITIEAILVARQKRRKRIEIAAPKLRYVAIQSHAPLPVACCGAVAARTRYAAYHRTVNRCATRHIHTTDEQAKKTQLGETRQALCYKCFMTIQRGLSAR